MSRCTHSPPKHRVSRKKSGHPNDYRHGMRGHTWEKLNKEIYQDTDSVTTICIGRRCKKCGKIVLNPTGENYARK